MHPTDIRGSGIYTGLGPRTLRPVRRAPRQENLPRGRPCECTVYIMSYWDLSPSMRELHVNTHTVCLVSPLKL